MEFLKKQIYLICFLIVGFLVFNFNSIVQAQTCNSCALSCYHNSRSGNPLGGGLTLNQCMSYCKKDGCTEYPVNPYPVCAEGAKRCNSGNVEKCGGGNWMLEKVCSLIGGSTCAEGGATGHFCKPPEKKLIPFPVIPINDPKKPDNTGFGMKCQCTLGDGTKVGPSNGCNNNTPYICRIVGRDKLGKDICQLLVGRNCKDFKDISDQPLRCIPPTVNQTARCASPSSIPTSKPTPLPEPTPTPKSTPTSDGKGPLTGGGVTGGVTGGGNSIGGIPKFGDLFNLFLNFLLKNRRY
jgi:hypothetical protein